MNLREAFEAVEQKNGGVLTTGLVLDEARRNRSAAGKVFHSKYIAGISEKEAAERFRHAMVAKDIRRFKVTYREATEEEAARKVRVYTNVPTEHGNVYQRSEAVVQDPFALQLTLQQMRREWQSMKRRYSHFQEFAEMIASDPLVVEHEAA